MQRFLGDIIRKSYDSFESWRGFSNSRKQAKFLSDKVVKRKGYSFVNKKLINRIREYSDVKFNSPDYWPWLALYTEIREEFIEGWIPDDYYTFELLPRLNPQSVSSLSMIKSYDHRLFSDFSLKPIAVKISDNFYTYDQRSISFDKAIMKCKVAHQQFPYVRFIAWDVFINEDREPKLIEWNARKPGMWRYESTLGPLWDPDWFQNE